MEFEEAASKVFLDYFSIFLKTLKYFGVHSMTFYRKNPYDKRFSVKATIGDISLLIFSITIYLYFIVKNMKHQIVFSVNDTVISKLGMYLVYLGFVFQTAGCAVMNFFNRNNILKLFNKMLEVEKEGRELGFTIDYQAVGRRIQLRNIVFTLLSIVIWTSNLTVYWLYREDTSTLELILLIGSYFWIYIGYFLFVFNMIFVIRVGIERYKLLSQMVE